MSFCSRKSQWLFKLGHNRTPLDIEAFYLMSLVCSVPIHSGAKAQTIWVKTRYGNQSINYCSIWVCVCLKLVALCTAKVHQGSLQVVSAQQCLVYKSTYIFLWFNPLYAHAKAACGTKGVSGLFSQVTLLQLYKCFIFIFHIYICNILCIVKLVSLLLLVQTSSRGPAHC